MLEQRAAWGCSGNQGQGRSSRRTKHSGRIRRLAGGSQTDLLSKCWTWCLFLKETTQCRTPGGGSGKKTSLSPRLRPESQLTQKWGRGCRRSQTCSGSKDNCVHGDPVPVNHLLTRRSVPGYFCQLHRTVCLHHCGCSVPRGRCGRAPRVLGGGKCFKALVHGSRPGLGSDGCWCVRQVLEL